MIRTLATHQDLHLGYGDEQFSWLDTAALREGLTIGVGGFGRWIPGQFAELPRLVACVPASDDDGHYRQYGQGDRNIPIFFMPELLPVMIRSNTHPPISRGVPCGVEQHVN